MPFVGSGVDRDPPRAGLVGEPGEFKHIWHAGAPRVAEQCDLVEVDAESCHLVAFRPIYSLRRPGAGQGPALLWILAFAGMTREGCLLYSRKSHTEERYGGHSGHRRLSLRGQ